MIFYRVHRKLLVQPRNLAVFICVGAFERERSVADGDNRYTQRDAMQPDSWYHHFRESTTWQPARELENC